MEERFIDPNYEFEAPQFVNFCDGLDDEDPYIDAWFDGKPDDEGGVQIPIDVDETEMQKEDDSQRAKRRVVIIPQKEGPIVSECEPKETPIETKNTEKSVESTQANVESTQATKVNQIQSDVKENIKEVLISETKQTTDADQEAACIQPATRPENDAELKSCHVTDNTALEKVEQTNNEIKSSENIDEQANVERHVEIAEKNELENVEDSNCLDGEKGESDADSQKEGQTNSSENSDTAEEGQKNKRRNQEKRVTRASERNRSIDSFGISGIPIKKKKQTSGGSTRNKRTRSICSNPEIKAHPITVPITPECLKRQKTNKPSMIKLKTTEELEMECIAKLRKQTKHHIKVNENLMKKAISCPAVNAIRANGTSLTRPQEFHFQTDRRLKQHPMTTRADQPDLNGEDTEKEFWNSLRQHPPSPSWKNRTATVPKPFNLTDGGQRKRKRSVLDKDVSETDSYQSMAYQVYKFQTTTPPRFRTRKANDSGFKSDNEGIDGGPEKAASMATKPVTMPKTPNLTTKTRSRPLAEGVLSKEEREEKEMEEIKNYKFKAKPFDRRIVECEGMYGVKMPGGEKTVTEPKPFVFESDERLAARKDKVTEDQEQTVNFKALPQPNFEKVFRPQLKHERTEPRPFSFVEKDKERWQKKEDKIQEVYKEEEKLREFKAQPLPSDSPDPLPAVSSKCGTSIKPFALNTENRGARKAEKWIQKVKSELEECRSKATFKAKPCKVVHDAPFVPQKSTKPLTEVSKFVLNTNYRAERREELETHKKEREQIDEELRKQREAEREREELEAIAILRKQMVHKAQPIHKYKMVKIKPSDQPLTEAHSPAWSEMKRRRVESHR